MQVHFNLASLAKLTEAQLGGLLRKYQNELSQSCESNEQAALNAKLLAIRMALALK